MQNMDWKNLDCSDLEVETQKQDIGSLSLFLYLWLLISDLYVMSNPN